MFKLVFLLLLFIVFLINYLFSYIFTMPYFKFITKFNIYEYFLDNFQKREWYFTWVEAKTVTLWWEEYLVDYTWGIFLTNLKYLSKNWDTFKIYVPIFILHTWDSLIISGDNIFSGWKFAYDFEWYTYFVSWWYSYVLLWKQLHNGKFNNDNIFFWTLYTYCSMTGTKWIDAYLYDRYLAWNKSWNYKTEQKDSNYDYVCENDRTQKECPNWYSECTDDDCQKECYREILWFKDYKDKEYMCLCDWKWEYYLCKNENSGSCDTSASNSYDACIDYYTWTVDLNNTNCSLSGALGVGNKAKYFLIR